MNNLTDFEFTLLWMSIRYAMNSQTIACASLPHEIVVRWHKRMTDSHKKSIVTDLKRNLSENGDRAFGHPTIDRPVWLKFMSALDEENHFDVELTDNTVLRCFESNGEIFPLEKYLNRPYVHVTISPENIVQKVTD